METKDGDTDGDGDEEEINWVYFLTFDIEVLLTGAFIWVVMLIARPVDLGSMIEYESHNSSSDQTERIQFKPLVTNKHEDQL